MLHRSIRGYLISVMFLCALLATSLSAQIDPDEWNALIDRWLELDSAGKYPEAEKVARRLFAHAQPGEIGHYQFLGITLLHQMKYDEARPLLETHLKLCRSTRRNTDVLVESLVNLGILYADSGRMKEAQDLYKEALETSSALKGPHHVMTLACHQNLAQLSYYQGDLVRSEKLYRQLVDAQYRNSEVEAPNRLRVLSTLGDIYIRLGKFNQAEANLRYGLELAKTYRVSPQHPAVIGLVQKLAYSFQEQGRLQEALPLYEWAAETTQASQGKDSVRFADAADELAGCYLGLDETEKGLAILQRVSAIKQKALGPRHPDFGVHHARIGSVYLGDDRPGEAEKSFRLALEISEEAFGPQHIQSAGNRILLGAALLEQDRDNEAEPLFAQALKDLKAAGTGELRRHDALRGLATVAWKKGDMAGAIKLLSEALDLAESSRANASGADVERAASFSQFAYLYELMIQWQGELGNPADALATLERAKARTFLEALSMPGADLLMNRTPQERQQVLAREAELRTNITMLESELDRLPSPTKDDSEAVQAKRQDVLQALANARAELYEHYRDLRASSPVYRQLISVQAKVPTLAEVQKQVVGEKSLLLSYYLGDEGSYVLVVRPDRASVVPLVMSEDAAKDLGVKGGPLTRDTLQEILMNKAGNGVLQRLSKSGPIDDALPKLKAMWLTLMPEDVREEILSEKLQRLVILPEGPLALFPMEALITSLSPAPTYLLDVAPAIQYAPSAAVLMNLSQRPAIAPAREPVLTLGNPAYGKTETERSGGDILSLAARGKRDGAIRAILHPLPHTEEESKGVKKAFEKTGAKVVQFLGRDATEANVRSAITGRHFVHLACHGMSDDAYGNFFGTLAVAPGPRSNDPQNDGMITLSEIYDLNLKGCELSILSACMTNHGPQQKGEGVWALSRGFLVAGSRRVIASNWVIDDEAGASLISLACTDIAAAQQKGKPDYAAALQSAKRQIRNQSKWQSPYYWAPFVLVGPN